LCAIGAGPLDSVNGRVNVSETAAARTDVTGPPPGTPAPRRDLWGQVQRGLIVFGQQREAAVFVVAVLLFAYFWLTNVNFFTKLDLINLSQIAAPIIIIAIGEVFLLICGEIDLSVGFIFTLAPFLMHYLIDFYGVPAVPAILISLLMGVAVGWFNGFFTVTMGLPSFITTLATGFILLGIVLFTSHAEPAIPSASLQGIGHWISTYAWAEISWAIALTLIFHIVLTRTRWGLHTIAAGGNLLGSREAGIKVNRIKYGNFMITGGLGAFVGIQVALQVNDIDPSSGQYQPMFYAVAAAVIGGTAMLGGSGTIIGAFFGSMVLAILTDGFNVAGINANVLNIIFGAAILVAMIANVQLARLRGAGRT
jgi:simple sugar transport system permease protein